MIGGQQSSSKRRSRPSARLAGRGLELGERGLLMCFPGETGMNGRQGNLDLASHLLC